MACGQPSEPADPLLAGLPAGLSATLNSVQTQKGIQGNLSTCLDISPSATLQKAPGPTTSLCVGHKRLTYGSKHNPSPVPFKNTKTETKKHNQEAVKIILNW